MGENRTVWIIDGSYLMKAPGGLGRFDYIALRKALEKRAGPISEAYYLNTLGDRPSEAQASFHTWLKFAPPKGPQLRVQLYQMKGVQVECDNCGTKIERSVQKGVDVGIATLILKLAHQNRYERLLLSCGDGDIEDAVQHVQQELDKEVVLAGFQDTISADLQSYASRVLWINEFWDEIKR